MSVLGLGPFALFARPLIDEEVPTLMALEEWTSDLDLTPMRGAVELSRTETYPRRVLNAPKLARQHDRHMRRSRE